MQVVAIGPWPACQAYAVTCRVGRLHGEALQPATACSGVNIILQVLDCFLLIRDDGFDHVID